MNKPMYGRYPGPMTNAERQRRFRERNPGYYGRLHRKRNAEINARLAAQYAAEASAQPEPLALPSPVEQLRIPGVNTIPTRAEFEAMRAIAAEMPVKIPQG